MPEGGDGWYADWWNGGKRGDPSWESYILDQVIPQIQERYPIRPERRWHSLAGVSMGGLGTAYLGGRLPGFFGSIAVFSGFVDTQIVPVIEPFQAAIAYAGAGLAPTDPFIVTGPPGGFYETGHNPTKLAANLAHTRVFMTTGDGTPLVQDPGGTFVGLGIVGQSEELAIIRPMSDSYAAALRAAGVDLTYDSHPGNHDWDNFRAEFKAAVVLGPVRAGGGAAVGVGQRHGRHARHLVGRRLSVRCSARSRRALSPRAATGWRSARRARR